MTRQQQRKVREILKTRRAELVRELRKRDLIAIFSTPDVVDAHQSAMERELAVRKLSRATNALREVEAALKRIEEGTFGICMCCEEEIAARRLAAIPWTPLCLHCQEVADQKDEHVCGFLERFQLAA